MSEGAHIKQETAHLQAALAWIFGIGGVLTASLLIWIGANVVETRQNVAIILDRPAPLSKEQYESDKRYLYEKLGSIDERVKAIEGRQVEARNVR